MGEWDRDTETEAEEEGWTICRSSISIGTCSIAGFANGPV